MKPGSKVKYYIKTKDGEISLPEKNITESPEQMELI
jgi:hypothetical protein